MQGLRRSDTLVESSDVRGTVLELEVRAYEVLYWTLPDSTMKTHNNNIDGKLRSGRIIRGTRYFTGQGMRSCTGHSRTPQ